MASEFILKLFFEDTLFAERITIYENPLHNTDQIWKCQTLTYIPGYLYTK
jgi:hypothetical protein